MGLPCLRVDAALGAGVVAGLRGGGGRLRRWLGLLMKDFRLQTLPGDGRTMSLLGDFGQQTCPGNRRLYQGPVACERCRETFARRACQEMVDCRPCRRKTADLAGRLLSEDFGMRLVVWVLLKGLCLKTC